MIPCCYIGSVILTFMGKMDYILGLIWVCPLQEAENLLQLYPHSLDYFSLYDIVWQNYTTIHKGRNSKINQRQCWFEI